MSGPALLYRNILRLAEEGRGNGYIYASGGGMVAADKTARTFEVDDSSTTGFDIMAGYGDSDDQFNGMLLVFQDGGRRYHIIGYLESTSANGPIIKTYETPDEEDIGGFEIRQTLYADKQDPNHPVHLLVDGRSETKWWSGADAAVTKIRAFLPNAIDDGGFELADVDLAWAVTANGTAEITAVGGDTLGLRRCRFDIGDQGNCFIEQDCKIDLKKGRTYGLIFFFFLDTSYDEFGLRIELNGDIGYTFEEIHAEDTTTDAIWFPELTTTSKWHAIKFEPDGNVSAGGWGVRFMSSNDAYLYIDEVYIWEIVDSDVMVIAGHNMKAQFQNNAYLAHGRCDPQVTYTVEGDLATRTNDHEQVVVFISDLPQWGSEDPIYWPYTGIPEITPVFEISFNHGQPEDEWEASSIWLGPTWDWDRFVQDTWEPHNGEVQVFSSQAWGGSKTVAERFRARRVAGTIPYIDNAAYQEWLDFILHAGGGEPFWYFMAGLSWLGSDDELMFMRNSNRPDIKATSRRLKVSFDFEEAV